MMKAERVREGVKLGLMGHVCDSCRTVPCAVFCRTDSVYLCPGCDARMHVASRHERVWVCEVCEHAPAILTCKADAAALCMACDADIHSANPLARRHQRIPILPISHGFFGAGREGEEEVEVEEEDGSLLLIDPGRNQNGCEFMCGGEVGDYLDLVEYRPYGEENHYHDGNKRLSQWQEEQNEKKNDGSDCVVPVHGLGIEDDGERQMKKMNQECLELEFESSKGGYSYTTSLSRSVSLSSMDAVVVPDTTMTEISNSHIGSAYLSTGPLQVPPQFSLMDREARVLRYKEKKKNRKFEKTIRYASRKAYAETRPRIKGRFAKRTDVEVELDQIYSANVMAETGYGIVPSF